jgi:hypothetical protein
VSELETIVKHSASAGDWIGDWDDVLRRAGHTRSRSARVAAIATGIAVAVVLVLPGIGIGGGLDAWISGSRPGLHLHAALRLPTGETVGTLELSASRIFVAKGRPEPKPFFVPRGHRPVLPPLPLRWSLDLADGKTAGSAVVQDGDGKVIARLCAPCGNRAHGTVELHPRALISTFRAEAVVKTSAGTARGLLRLPVPVR